jgi:hypothetical protein
MNKRTEAPAGEPLIHSFHTDQLPEEHRWANRSVACGCCGAMVHAFNNECMQVWVEWGDWVLCWDCFLPVATHELDWTDFRDKANKHAAVVDG